jgi:hypothetical protein
MSSNSCNKTSPGFGYGTFLMVISLVIVNYLHIGDIMKKYTNQYLNFCFVYFSISG